MATFRERVTDVFLGPQKRQLQGVIRDLVDAYQAGPFELATSPEQLKATLKEYDSAVVQDLVNEIEWERLGSMGYDVPWAAEQRRVRAVKESRRLWIYDVVTSFIIQLWTDFGFGENVAVTPNDEKAAAIWNAYWTADENDPVLSADNLQGLSETVLVDGDLFIAYFASTLDGKVTARVVDAIEIVEVITDPDDAGRPLFYKRVYSAPGMQSKTVYYPAWLPWISYKQAAAGSQVDPFEKVASKLADGTRADTERATTVVVMQHCAYKRKGGLRGWPLMTAGAPWSREHRRFRENRAAVAAAIAMYVQKVKAKGGSRAIDAIRAKLQSSLASSGSTDAFDRNPPAAAGSTWLENDAAELTRLPLSTNASDAQHDGGALLMMAGLGGGVYPHWLGAGEAFRLATATAMEAPMHRQFSRYKLFWGEQFRRMLKIVLACNELFGNPKGTFEDTSAKVSTDRLIEVDLEMISEAVSTLTTNTLQPYFEAGLIDEPTAGAILQSIWVIALQALGVDKPEEIATPAGFGMEEPAQESGLLAEGHKPKRRPFVSGRAFLREVRREQLTMSEAVSHQADYGAGLRAIARGMWGGDLTRGEALDAFGLQIETGLRWAWIEGTEAAGIPRDEQTAEDLAGADDWISAELQHLPGLLDFIEAGSKAKDGKLAPILARVELWANRWMEVYNTALLAARNDPKLKWNYGQTEDHCTDCAGYVGKVYRASVWLRWGAQPQSRELECHGYKCDCRLDPTTERLTSGHPRRPTGG